jgi:hypothetical protein
MFLPILDCNAGEETALLLIIRTTHKPATDLGFLLHKRPDRAHRSARRCFQGGLSLWFNYAVGGRCDPKGLHINKRIK